MPSCPVCLSYLLTFGATLTLAFGPPLGAYDLQLNNTLPRGSGPVIPYNGSDGVPARDTLSPLPEPLPQLRYVTQIFDRGKW